MKFSNEDDRKMVRRLSELCLARLHAARKLNMSEPHYIDIPWSIRERAIWCLYDDPHNYAAAAILNGKLLGVLLYFREFDPDDPGDVLARERLLAL